MESLERIFTEAADYADKYSTCRKVHVGACFITKDGYKVYSCNNGGASNCNELGYCYKAHVTGIYESTEETRKYCQSTHAEINMLKTLKEHNINPANGTLYVCRYPCRNCLTKCIEAGIKDIKFCGVSEGTTPEENKQDCKEHNVNYEWHPEFDYEFHHGRVYDETTD